MHPNDREDFPRPHEPNEQLVYLDTVALSNKFISRWLAPAVAYRYGRLQSGMESPEHAAPASAESDTTYFTLNFWRGLEPKSPTEYVISAVTIEPYEISDYSMWRQFVEMVNNHPMVPETTDDQEPFIDPYSTPEDHEIKVITTKDFGFRYGRRVGSVVRYSYLVNDVEFELEFETPDAERYQVNKDMNDEEKYFTTKEWEIGASFSADEMKLLLEAMERLKLRRVRKQTSVAIPEL